VPGLALGNIGGAPKPGPPGLGLNLAAVNQQKQEKEIPKGFSLKMPVPQ